MDPAQNGHYFLRVSSADYRRPDGKRVHTVRDVILEVDKAVTPSMNSVSLRFSIPTATTSLRRWTRVPCA